jgi:hypothetical protein
MIVLVAAGNNKIEKENVSMLSGTLQFRQMAKHKYIFLKKNESSAHGYAWHCLGNKSNITKDVFSELGS